MKNGLVPEKRMDRNGKTSTRWVKPGVDGKIIQIPSPKSKTGSELALQVNDSLYPQEYVEGRDVFAVTLSGTSTFYSKAFAHSALKVLPVKTLKLLSSTLDRLPQGDTRRFVAQVAYEHVKEMHDMGNTKAAKYIAENFQTHIANACTFADVLSPLSKIKDLDSVSSQIDVLMRGVSHLENKNIEGVYASSSVHNFLNTQQDYSTLPKETIEKVQAEVVAFTLHQHFGSGDFSPWMTAVASEYRSKWDELVEFTQERGFDDEEAVREYLDSSTLSIRDGFL